MNFDSHLSRALTGEAALMPTAPDLATLAVEGGRRRTRRRRLVTTALALGVIAVGSTAVVLGTKNGGGQQQASVSLAAPADAVVVTRLTAPHNYGSTTLIEPGASVLPKLSAEEAVARMYGIAGRFKQGDATSVTASFGVLTPSGEHPLVKLATPTWLIHLTSAPYDVPGPVAKYNPRCDFDQYIDAATGADLGAVSACTPEQQAANQDFLKESGAGGN